MRCFCFPSIFENSHFWKQKFVIFIIFLEMFQNSKSWCFLFQPQFRNVLKATNNSLYPFFQDFPEFEVLDFIFIFSGKVAGINFTSLNVSLYLKFSVYLPRFQFTCSKFEFTLLRFQFTLFKI